jgi:signal transduction histidine kinase
MPVLIYGEVGCGQESVARGIYEIERPDGSWVSLSCAALNDNRFAHGLGQLLDNRGERGPQLTLFLNHVESLDPLAQASLLRWLEEEEDRGRVFWMLSAARADLLEQVYRGEFLDTLYYRLASLSLYLAPLRKRRDEIPALAARVAQDCGNRLGLGHVALTQDAVARLSNYLWFGNLREMETLMTRTLASRRKTLVEAGDLIFTYGGDAELPAISGAEEVAGDVEERNLPEGHQREKRTASTGMLNGSALDLTLVVNELAHELKNPMVTIKTFSQLLGDRYDDPVFRSRFREMVSGDIERMDDLLENLLDFSRMGQPVMQAVSLLEQLRYVLAGVLPESSQSWINEQLMNMGEDTDVFVDPEHLRYALKSLIRAAQFEAKRRGEVDIHTEGEGTVVISYAHEGGRVLSLHQYLDPNSRSPDMDHEGMSLRVILAKALIEKNGGKIKMERDDTGGVQVRVELPVAQPQARKL